jgi:hypothetical protein
MTYKKVKIQDLLAGIFIMLGIVLRTKQFISFRSLWLDEVLISLNILNRSISGLFQPLDLDQGAPIGFLLVQKIIIQLLGNKDYFFRLFPFVAGIASLFLMYVFMKRYSRGAAVLIAMSLFAISEPLIYYSSEAKQYGIEVSVALALYVFFYRYIKSSWSYRTAILLGLVGAVSIWLSFSALFILTGLVGGLTIYVIYRKEWKKLKYLFFITGSILGLNFIVIYLLSLRPLATSSFLLAFWKHRFMPMPPWNDLTWFPKYLQDFNEFVLKVNNIPIALLVLLLFLIGVLSVIQIDGLLAIVLYVPIVATLLVSGFHKYPFWERLLLFLSPIFFLSIAEGINRVQTGIRHYSKSVSYMLLILLWVGVSYPAAVKAYQTYKTPNRRQDLKNGMVYLQQHLKEGDKIYLFHRAYPVFTYYLTFYKLPVEDVIYGSKVVGPGETYKYIQDLYRLCVDRPNKRIWFLLSHIQPDELRLFRDFFENHGNRLDSFMAPGTYLYLYRLDCTGLPDYIHAP